MSGFGGFDYVSQYVPANALLGEIADTLAYIEENMDGPMLDEIHKAFNGLADQVADIANKLGDVSD